MNIDNAKTNIGYYFTAFNRRCQVLSVATFNGTVHFGFQTVDESRYVIGWVPATFIGGCEMCK